MKLQLKNVHFSERLSQETNAFAADIHYNGKKVGYAENDGHGGCTNVNCFSETIDAFNEAEAYAKTLPKIVYEGYRGLKGFEIDSNLEALVDRLFENWLAKKEVQKESAKGIFIQKPNGVRATITWKGFNIAKLLKHPKGEELIRVQLLKTQSEGNKVLNTNLGSLLG